MAKKKKVKKASFRDAEIVIIMGRNGTGKSTFAEKLIKAMKQRALVITLNGAPKIWRPYPLIDITNKQEMQSFKGIRQVHYFAHEGDTFEHIYRNYFDGLIIFDDCRGYLPANIDTHIYFKRMLMDFRHRMWDLTFIVHTPEDLPYRLWSFGNTFFIGATGQYLNKNKVKSDVVDELIQAQGIVNKKFKAAKAKNNNSHYGIFKMVRG